MSIKTPDTIRVSANTALSNLANVAVNTDILPDTDSLRNLGSSLLRWNELYIKNIFALGNVGIGTPTPGYELDVAGTINMTGFRMPTGATNGYILTSDTSGVGTWQPAAPGLPSGTSGQTLRHDGTSWIANNLLFNNGTNIGIGTATPLYQLDVNGAVRAVNYNAGINVEVLAADKTLDPAVDKMYQYLDPGTTSRIITLATTTAKAGDRFVIRHNGDYTNSRYLKIQQESTLLDNIYAGAIKEFIFDGTNWVTAGTGAGEVDNKKYNVAIGYNTSGYSSGAAVGSYASGYSSGAAVGYNAFGSSSGAAVGSYTSGYSYGAAVGRSASGYSYGVAVGNNAQGMRRGVAVGYYAGGGLDSSADRYNIFIGYQAGRGITTGSNNIIIGRQNAVTGRITTGSNNILIGYEVGAGIASTTSNQLNIGNLIFGTGLTTGTTVSTGNVGIGTTTPTISGTGKLHMAADTMRLDTARTITNSTDAGNTGEICWDANFLYICVSTNSWRRVALSAW